MALAAQASDPVAEGIDRLRCPRDRQDNQGQRAAGAFARAAEPTQHATHDAVAAGEMELVGVRRMGIQGERSPLVGGDGRDEDAF